MLEKYLPAASNITPINKPVTHSKESAILDHAILDDFTDGDANTEKRILEIFLTNLKDDISSMHKCYLTNNFEEWEKWAHKLYGACAHIGANAMADICDQAQFVKANDNVRMKDLHHDILDEYKKLYALLEKKQSRKAVTTAA